MLILINAFNVSNEIKFFNLCIDFLIKIFSVRSYFFLDFFKYFSIKLFFTSNFNSHNAKQFVESLNETANSLYYVFLGKHTSFTDDNTPPTQNNSPEDAYYQPYRDMIYGKQVTTSDIKHMVANNAWVANTVYAQYDHRDGALKDKNFFVHVEEANGDFSVFKCLGNNKGAPSIDKPSASETSANEISTLQQQTDINGS